MPRARRVTTRPQDIVTSAGECCAQSTVRWCWRRLEVLDHQVGATARTVARAAKGRGSGGAGIACERGRRQRPLALVRRALCPANGRRHCIDTKDAENKNVAMSSGETLRFWSADNPEMLTVFFPSLQHTLSEFINLMPLATCVRARCSARRGAGA